MSKEIDVTVPVEVISNCRGFLGSSTEVLLSQTISRISSIWSALDQNQAPKCRQKPMQQNPLSFPRRREPITQCHMAHSPPTYLPPREGDTRLRNIA